MYPQQVSAIKLLFIFFIAHFLLFNHSFSQCNTTITSFPYSQSFESGIGDWEQGTGDDFDWTVDNGGTPSGATGPTNASDGTNYIYVEASAPNYPNNTADLLTPCFDLSCDASSLNFDYHMYGATTGTLDVEVEAPAGSGNWTQVFTISGDQGNTWNSTTIDLSAFLGQTIKVRFAAETGSSYTGDITIDNFNITCISCPPVPSVSASPTSVNCGGTSVLTASGGSGSYIWYSDAAGTNQIGTGSSYTTPSITSPTTFYVSSAPTTGGNYNQTIQIANPTLASTNTFNFTGTPTGATGGTLTVTTYGDIDGTGGNEEMWTINDEGGTTLGTIGATGTFADQCGATLTITIPLTGAQIDAWAANGSIDFTGLDVAGNISTTLCGAGQDMLELTLDYTVPSVSCPVNTTPITVGTNVTNPTVNAAPSTVTCGGPSSLTASGGPGSYTWYSDATANNQIGTGSNYTTPSITSTTTYYVTATTTSTGNYNQTVQIANPALASTNTFTFTATPTGATGGTLTVTTYGDIDGTGGNEEMWTIEDEGGATLGTIGATGTFADQCGTTLTITIPLTGAQINAWAANGSIDFTGLDIAGNVNTTLCGVGQDMLELNLDYNMSSSACDSDTIPVTVTANPLSAPTVTSPVTICNPATATLNATGSSGNYTWFDNAAGTNQVGTGNSYTTPNLTASATYYVQATAGGTTPSTISTTYAGGNGQDGAMFDINTLQDITINDFSINANAGTGDFEVYYKTGSYVGNQGNAGAWTLVGTATNITSAGPGNPTPLGLNLGLSLTAGQTYSFYITSTGLGIDYTNGTTAGNVFTSNADMEILEGIGLDYPFGTTYDPRVWNGTIDYDVGSPTSCTSSLTPVTVQVDQPSVAATGITGGGTFCLGTDITLSVQGGTLSGVSDWEWYSGSCTGTPVGTGNSITVSPGSGTTNYYVRASANGACAATNCANGSVNIPSPANILSIDNSNEVCIVNQNGYVHFLDNNGRLIISINSNGQNLGNVSATSYVDPSPLLVDDCQYPSNLTYSSSVLQRHWVVSPQFQPTGLVNIRLPFDSSMELPNLMAAANTNMNATDNVNTIFDLELSKYSGPLNIDDQFNNNCPANGGNGGVTFHMQSANGQVQSYIAGHMASDRYVEYTISNFSELWLTGSSINSPLPIELKRFTNSCKNNETMVQWVTASESNSAYFSLERSTDGIEWNSVGKVEAAGVSNNEKTYEYKDKTAPYSLYYYRLVSVDQNGQKDVSNVIKGQNCKDINNQLTLYPNPASDIITIEKGGVQGDYKLSIMDSRGKVIFQKNNSVKTTSLMKETINVTNFARGTYFVKVVDADGVSEMKKFVVTR